MKRRDALATALAGMLVLSGCATPQSSAPRDDEGARRVWTGRMSLRVDSPTVQSFSALFELRGNAQKGVLTLTSPIGSTLGQASWSPGEAILSNGNVGRQYDSAGEMIQAATGADIPLDALFAWLEGRDVAVPGWKANLSQINEGRLQATRESPQPTADLRVIFERP